MSELRKAAQQALDALEKCSDWPGAYDACSRAVHNLRAALAEPDSDYERGFVDGMNLQTKRSVDKAVNRMAEPRPIQECYGDCPTNPQTCPNPCNFEGRPKPEQKPQTTHWEGCEAVHPECKTEQEPDGISWLKRDSGYFTAPTPQREHITDGSPCWCNPDVIEEEGGNVIVHNYDDNWQQYAKPGETAQQCIERHRGEQDALMKLYATPRKPEQKPVAWWNGKETVWFEHELMGTNPPIENAIPLYTAPPQRKPVELTDDEIALIVGECAASAHRYGDFSFARAVIAAYEAKNGITGEQT